MQPDWEIWLDNQLSSYLAKMMAEELNMPVMSAFKLGIKNFEDKEIYIRAKNKGKVILITKDADFPTLITEMGSPPKLIKLNTGNLPTQILWSKYKDNFITAIQILQTTDAEIIFIE
ncbi:MAG: DUF5615 family PIN-like protein [Ferruginibacter sp.]